MSINLVSHAGDIIPLGKRYLARQLRQWGVWIFLGGTIPYHIIILGRSAQVSFFGRVSNFSNVHELYFHLCCMKFEINCFSASTIKLNEFLFLCTCYHNMGICLKHDNYFLETLQLHSEIVS